MASRRRSDRDSPVAPHDVEPPWDELGRILHDIALAHTRECDKRDPELEEAARADGGDGSEMQKEQTNGQ